MIDLDLSPRDAPARLFHSLIRDLARNRHRQHPLRSAGIVAAAILVVTGTSALTFARTWRQLAGDGVHDPGISALEVLQEPQEALRELPARAVGDQVDWVKALEERHINPRAGFRAGVSTGSATNVLDLDVLMKRTKTMPYVRFSHKPHVEWLDCSNCHDELFKAEIGANANSMVQLALGESCGRCHFRVAFPLRECGRCHNVPREGAGVER